MFVLLSIIGFLLLAAVVYFSDPAGLWRALLRADLAVFVAGFLLLVVILLLNGYRFFLLSHRLLSLSFREAFHVLAFSQVANQGALAMFGEVGKGAMLKKSHGVSASRTMGVVLVERGQDVLFSVLFSVLLLYQYRPDALTWVVVFCAALLVVFGALLFLPSRFFGFFRVFGAKPLEMIENFRLGALEQDRRTLVFSVGVTFVALMLGGFANQLVLQAFGANVDFFVVLSINSAGLLLGVLSGLPAGLGSREASLVLLYGLFGVAAPVVLAASITVRVLFTALSYLGFLASRPLRINTPAD